MALYRFKNISFIRTSDVNSTGRHPSSFLFGSREWAWGYHAITTYYTEIRAHLTAWIEIALAWPNKKKLGTFEFVESRGIWRRSGVVS